MTDLEKTIAELEKLIAEATPGPWEVIEDSAAQVKGYPVIESAECEIVGSEGFYNQIETDWANARLIVAAVNALPELVALRKENERLRKQVSELSDCQPLPKVYKYTGTAEVDVENMFDVGHRHRNGKQPRDYLMSWLSMFRPFAYATKDDSWGELEKLISITMNNYVQMLARAETARAVQGN